MDFEQKQNELEVVKWNKEVFYKYLYLELDILGKTMTEDKVK